MQEEEKKEEQELSQEELARQWEEALAQQEGGKTAEEETQAPQVEEKQEEPPQTVQTQVAEVKKPSERDLSRLLDRIMDIPLNVEVVVGSTVIQIKELLNFGPGSVIELDRETTEPVDIKVNGKLIARGELVVVGEKFGIRITEIYAEERKSVFRDTLEGSLRK